MDKDKIRKLFYELLEEYEMAEWQIESERGIGEKDYITPEIIEWKRQINELLDT